MRLRILYVMAVLAAIIRADLEDAIYDLLLDLEQEVSGDPPCSCVINPGQGPYESFCIKACHDKSECDKFTVYCKWEDAHHALKPNHKELTPPKCPFASEGCGKDKMDSLTNTLFPESFCRAKGHCCNEWGGCGTKNCKDTCAYGPCGSEEWRRYDSGGCIRGTKHEKSSKPGVSTKPNASAQLQKCPWATSGCGIDKKHLGTTTLPKSYCQNEGDCCNKWGGCSKENCETENEFRNFDHLACFSPKKYITKPKKKPSMRRESCSCVIKKGMGGYETFCNPHCNSKPGCTAAAAKPYCDWKGESPDPSSPTPKPTSPSNGCDCVVNSGSENYIAHCNKNCDKENMCKSLSAFCHWEGKHTYHPPCPANAKVRCDKQCGPAVFIDEQNVGIKVGKFYCGEPGECCNTSGQCSKDESICKNMHGFNGDFDYGICPHATSEDCKSRSAHRSKPGVSTKPNATKKKPSMRRESCGCVIKKDMEGYEVYCNPHCVSEAGCTTGAAKSYCDWKGESPAPSSPTPKPTSPSNEQQFRPLKNLCPDGYILSNGIGNGDQKVMTRQQAQTACTTKTCAVVSDTTNQGWKSRFGQESVAVYSTRGYDPNSDWKSCRLYSTGCDCVVNSGSEAYVAHCNKHCDKENMCKSLSAFCHWEGKHTHRPSCTANARVRCDKQCGPVVNGSLEGKFFCGEPGECCSTSGHCSKSESICKNMHGFNGDFDYGICPHATSEDCKSRSAHRSRSAPKDKVPVLLKLLKAIDNEAENFQDLLYGTDMDELKDRLFN